MQWQISKAKHCNTQQSILPKYWHTIIGVYLKEQNYHPGRGAQLTRATSPYAKVVGAIPCQGTYRDQTMYA